MAACTGAFCFNFTENDELYCEECMSGEGCTCGGCSRPSEEKSEIIDRFFKKNIEETKERSPIPQDILVSLILVLAKHAKIDFNELYEKCVAEFNEGILCKEFNDAGLDMLNRLKKEMENK